jgi:hypothetical protein
MNIAVIIQKCLAYLMSINNNQDRLIVIIIVVEVEDEYHFHEEVVVVSHHQTIDIIIQDQNQAQQMDHLHYWILQMKNQD